MFSPVVLDSNGENYDLSVHGETGLVVAFRADIPHAVQPITHGERYAITSWFF